MSLGRCNLAAPIPLQAASHSRSSPITWRDALALDTWSLSYSGSPSALADVPEVQSISLDGFTGNPYNDSSPISVTGVIRAWPSVDSLTWGIRNDRFTNQFIPLGQSVNLIWLVREKRTADCEITEVLTLQNPDCTDTGNKFSLYAKNEQGNSTIKTSQNNITVLCSPRLADGDTANQTYRVCEGSPINMSAKFISVPGPDILWYRLPNTTRYLHQDRYNNSNRAVYYTTTYSIHAVYKYMFGSYVVEADNYRGPRVRAYIELLEVFNCLGILLN
ncbi:uncharacterized protein LOC134232254 [Saccostrea cucullata]|uniref:uncharacterized protein LOC134232254 n=1 Tax=Saccostrea cuccullata TaxID=36930 RepID=UPI002ED0A70E